MDSHIDKHPTDGMHSCPYCDSILVQPVDWNVHGDGRWQVQLRCPECEWRGGGRYFQTDVDDYDEELDRGCRQLIEDLRAVIRANMQEEADRFAAALATDRILPEDFHTVR